MKNLSAPYIELSRMMIIEIRIYAISRRRNFWIRLCVCTCNGGLGDGERDTCAFTTLCMSPHSDFKTNNYFYIKVHLWVSGSEMKSCHCYIPVYPRVWFFCICYCTRARVSDALCVRHDYDPSRIDIRIYGDRGSTLQGRYFIELYVYPRLCYEGLGSRRYCENPYFYWI